MKKILLAILVTMVSFQAMSQISVGIRNNRFINVSYLYKDHYSIKLEQSVFSESFGLQYMRGYVGYQTALGDFQLKGSAYFGATFNRLYFSTGTSADVRFRPSQWLIVDARLTPHYDSGFGYTTCYYGGIGCGITKQIDILAAFTNIPEYRMPEKRFNIGFDFHVKNLKVIPRLSLNISRNSGPKSLRPLIDLEYTFQYKKDHE